MAVNLAEKVNECLLNWGRQVLFTYNWDHETCPLYGVAGCPLFNIEVDGRTVGIFRIVLYIMGVLLLRGVLSRVQLYYASGSAKAIS